MRSMISTQLSIIISMKYRHETDLHAVLGHAGTARASYSGMGREQKLRSA